MGLIDKDIIVTEIERQLHYVNSWLEGHERVEDRRSNVYFRMLGNRSVLESIKDFINNLETKAVDLEKEIELVKGDYEQVDVAWNNDFDFIARHFYGLGLKAKEEKYDTQRRN